MSALGRAATVGSMDLCDARTSIDQVLSQRSGRPAFVSIDGHSASGKSTAAAALAEEYSASIVAGDHFYGVMDEAARALFTPAEGADQYYDWERMDAEALTPLAAGRTASFRSYDWASGKLSDALVALPPAPLIIVEGLFVSRPELRHRYVLSILVVADERRRWQRQLDRGDATTEWLRRWDDAERYHLTDVSPPEVFDVVLDGSSPAL